MRKSLTVLVVALLTITGLAFAPSSQADEWEYAITPYFFLPALDLDSTVAGQTVPVDISFGDVLDSFDVLALSIRGEGWQGPYGGVLDFYWVDLDGDFGPSDGINVQIQEWYLDVLAGYRWVETSNYSRPRSIDVTMGPRIHALDQQVKTPATPTLGGDDTFIDIIIGARLIQPLAEKWLLSLRGDIGGFDLTNGTKLNYSLTGGFGWEFTRNWLALLGSRVYGIDFESGSGINEFGLDGIEHGLWLGVSWAPVQ